MATVKAIAPVRGWLLVSEALESVLITTLSGEPVKVHVGTEEPAVDAPAHLMSIGVPFSMSGVYAQNIYIQSGCLVPVEVQVTAA